MAEYMRQYKRTRLQFQDWGIIKPIWKAKFSDHVLNSNLHIIFTGRVGYEYEDTIEEDERTGKKRREIHKSGVKMKAENETVYEPVLLVMMERYDDILGEKKEV